MLTQHEVRLLDRLTLGGAPAPASLSSGMRRARAAGRGLEFHDYRHYQPGDDPRTIDWTVEARLGQLVVRVARGEGHARLHVLIDVSGSMAVGVPDKLTCAARIAAALSYVAIEHRESTSVSSFAAGMLDRIPSASGRTQIFRVFEMLRRSSAAGRSAIDRSLLAYGAAVRGPGVAVVISDFLDPAGAEQGLLYLQHRGFAPAVVQVLAPEETDPDVADDLELLDIEDPLAPALTIDAAALPLYRRHLAESVDGLRAFCLTHGMRYVRLASDGSFDVQVAAVQQAGLLAALG